MNSVKKLSDENKSDVANECEKMSDEWWVMSYEWWKLSDENWVMKKAYPNRPLTSHPYASLVGRNISFGELGTKKKKMYLLTGVGPMNSVKKLSDENKSDVAKWVWKNEWWVTSDEWWVMKIEWWKKLTQHALNFSFTSVFGLW